MSNGTIFGARVCTVSSSRDWRAGTGWETTAAPNDCYRELIQSERQSEKESTRMLWQIFVWDFEDERLVADCYVPANNEADAKMAGVLKLGENITKKIEDYDVIALRLGSIREKKQVQEVRILEKE